jgi:hypothetical protein
VTDQVPKTRAPKATGPRAHIVTIEGKDWLLTLDNVRVATAADLNKALDGGLPRAKLSPSQAASGGSA